MTRRYHFDLAGGCPGWNRGVDFGTRYHGERGRRAIKSDAGRPCQIRSQNLDGRTNLARRGQRFYERSKPHGQAKDRANVAATAPVARTIELSISALGQTGRAEAVKAVKRCQVAIRSYFECCASGPATRAPVEIPACALHQSSRAAAVGTVGLRAKAVQRRQLAPVGDFENRTFAIGPATECCSVQVPIRSLDQPRVRVGTVDAVGLGAKTIQRLQRMPSCDLKESAATDADVAANRRSRGPCGARRPCGGKVSEQPASSRRGWPRCLRGLLRRCGGANTCL